MQLVTRTKNHLRLFKQITKISNEKHVGPILEVFLNFAALKNAMYIEFCGGMELW